ncbi:SpaA isopeptide-forming pilin-related protein [Anaerococcus tetradius]|uniref:F5/8 type C domain protein n=1 Tax=Anaerococcus tetradius ATCC 35098 TaxID=525255 RepID=C2CHF1_9FIRM|nr:SpaA isopeptide-forming pilin-related protein [Anaerococcus tetradius]EEI83033.1 F5/8 type C domain protein [Anaerococcus tetradius ATCC 35098]
MASISDNVKFTVYRTKQNWDPNFGMLTTKDGTKITPVLKREVSSNDNDFDEVNAKMNENTSEFEFYSLKDGKYWLVEGFDSTFGEGYELFKEIYGNIDNKILSSFEIENNRVSKVNGKPLTDSLIEVVNEKKATKFTIEKVDKVTKKALAGAEFTLYKGKEEITRQYSDSLGIVTFEDISPGTYRVVESKAPRAYKKSKTEIKVVVDNDLNIKINNQATNNIQVSNEKQSGISIRKIAEDGKALKGRAKFCIIPVDKGVSKENFEQALKTNGDRNARNCIWHENTDDKGDDSIKLNGKIYYLPKHSKVKNNLDNYQLFDVVDGSLERTNIKFKNPGKYIFAEYDAPKGYDIIKPVLLELKEVQGQLTYNIISGNSELTLDNHSEIMKFTAKDKIIRSKFALKKVKETANKNRNPIGADFTESKDVSFRLTKTNREIAARSDYDESDIDKTFATNGRVDKTWKTNQDVVFDNLRPGYYVLEETKFPEEYIKTGETYRIYVDDKGSIDFSIYSKEGLLRKYFITQFEMDYEPWFKDNGNLVRIDNRQEPKGKFAFYKKADSTTNPMAELYDRNLEAKFKLTKDGDTSFRAIEQTKKASEKFIFEDLKKGIYTLEEIQAPRGYLKTAKKYKISVDELGDVRIFEPTADEVPKKVSARFSHNLKTNSISNISFATDGNEGNEAVFNLKDSKINKGDYIQLDLGSIHYISKVKLLQNIKATSGNNDAFDDVDLEYSLDGTTFHKLKNYANTNPNKGTFDNSIRRIDENTPFCAKVVRIRNKVESGGRWLRLNEFMVEGYPVSLKKEISLENQKDLASKDNYIFEIGNLEIPKIKLIKTDENGRDIGKANAEFELRKVDDASTNVNNLTEGSGDLVYKILVKDGTSKLIDSKGKEVSDNQLSLDKLGKYILVEKTSPKFYKKLAKPILLEAYQDQVAISGGKKKVLWFKNVASDSNLTIGLEENGRLIKFSVKNKKIQSKFAFKKKIQSATNKPMQDIPNVNLQAEFKLTKDGLLSGFNPVIKKQNVSTIFEFANLEAGDYTLEETLAPAGFMKTNDKYKVKIDDYGNLVVYKDATNKTPAKINASLSHNFGSIQIDNIGNASDDNDNNEATFHLANSKLKKGDYLQLAFDGPNYVTSLKFLQNTVNQNTGRDIFDDFDIEYSLDGRNFYKAASYNNTFVNDKAIKTINLSNPFVAKYVRIRSNVESGSRWLRVASFEAQGYRVEPVKDMQNENQDNIAETDVFAIGNLENPKIKIIKQDDGGNEISSANAEFELRKVDDTNNDVNKLDDNSGELVHKISIENGQTKLKKADGTEIEGNQLQIEKLGKYILVEKVPPRGYRKLDKPILLNVKEDQVDGGNKKISWFEIKSSNNIASLNLDTSNGLEAIFKVKNEEIKSKFAFKKKAESLSAPMANIGGAKTATFKLTKDGDSSFTKTSTKNVSENFEFTDLKKGDYTLEETQAPTGFVKTDKLYKIRIDDEGTVRIFKASKDSKNSKIQKPKFEYKMNASPKNPSNATDSIENNETVFELSNSTVRKDDFIKLSFDKVHHISKIKLLLNNARANAGNDIFDDADLEYSLDGKTFVKYKNYKSGKRIEENVDLYAKEIRYRSNTQAGGRWFSVSEFEAYGYEADLVKELSQKDQEDISNNTFDIGNLQNPRLVLEKIDAKTNELIDTNKVNKDFTAKFALYKIPDDITSAENLNYGTFRKVKDFTLVNGREEFDDGPITELGRYLLSETANPDGYQIMKPIILDLVKIKGVNGTKLSLGWKLVSESLTNDVYNLQAEDANKKFDDKIEIDYSKLFEDNPTITLKVKNYWDDLGEFAFEKVDKKDKALIKGADFRLTKDDDDKFIPRDGYDETTNRYVFDFLSPGTYTLEETRLPDGYMKEDKILKAFVNEYGDTSLFTIKGKEKVGEIPLTKDNLIYSDRYSNYIADADKDRMFDNDKNSVGEVKLWRQSVGDHVEKDEFVGIDLKGLYRIDSFDFNQGPAKGSNSGNDAYDEFVIEYSLDGVNYRRFRKYKNPNGTNKPSDDKRGEVYDISENLNTYARYIRIRNLSRGERRWLKIRDISATGYKVEEIKNFRKNATVVPAKIDNIKKPRVKIIKNDDGNKKVSGAKFSLYKVLDDRIYSENKGEYKVSEITLLNKSYVKEIKKNFDLIDGEVIFESRDLDIDQLGKYILVEETAPKGCLKLKEPILLDLKEENGKAKVDVLSQKHMATSKLTSDDLVEITIKNHRFTYPGTGGRGIIFLSIIGALVMSLGIFLYQRKTSIER